MKSEIRCPVCGTKAIFIRVSNQEFECDCPKCGLRIRANFATEEEAREYFENMGKSDSRPKRKSADEMFRELRYEKTESGAGYPMYEDKHGVAIEIAVKADCIAKYHRDPYVPGCVPMTVKEHLAVARLIEEMEESE